MKIYEEVVDFIAAGTTPTGIVNFQPSEKVKERVADLIQKEKDGEILPEEKSELDYFMQLEHLMRLAKAKARGHLKDE